MGEGLASWAPFLPGRWRGQVQTCFSWELLQHWGPLSRSLSCWAPFWGAWGLQPLLSYPVIRCWEVPPRGLGAGNREQPLARGFSLIPSLGAIPLPHCGPLESAENSDDDGQYYSQEGSPGRGPEPVLQMSKVRYRKGSALSRAGDVRPHRCSWER